MAIVTGILVFGAVLPQNEVNLGTRAQLVQVRPADGMPGLSVMGSTPRYHDGVMSKSHFWSLGSASKLASAIGPASASILPLYSSLRELLSIDRTGTSVPAIAPRPDGRAPLGQSHAAPGVDSQAVEGSDSVPDWLEPRGLNVVDLVGLVPDEILQGMILSFRDGIGIVVYESGSRDGDTVVVTAKIYPRFDDASWVPNNKLTIFGCLGQTPHFDHMGSVAPPSTLRVYSGDVDVTSEIQYMIVSRMGRLLPYYSSREPFRYWGVTYGPGWSYPLPLGPEGLALTQNSGCEIWIPGKHYYPLTGVFTVTDPQPVRAEVLGTQYATFHSYIGPGNVGVFSPLMNQMDNRYGWRHGRVTLEIPGGANFFLAKYPPMPGDAFTDMHWGPPNLNADRPSSGTYRLEGDELGTDLTISAAFPLQVAWRDSDLSSGDYLPIMRNPPELALPEYVIPAGVPFNTCFTAGGCPTSVLEQVYNTVMSMEIHYLSITKPRMHGDWISLKMAGPAWSPPGGETSSVPTESEPSLKDSLDGPSSPSATYRVFFPFASAQIYDPIPTGCPCGWFDMDGAMLGFWPGP